MNNRKNKSDHVIGNFIKTLPPKKIPKRAQVSYRVATNEKQISVLKDVGGLNFTTKEN